MATILSAPAQEAARVLQETGARVPVNPVFIAHRLKATVKAATFSRPDVAGALQPSDSGWILYVRSSDSIRRQRFTIAHELGHLLLHVQEHPGGMVDEDINFFRTDGNVEGDRRQEIEANQFAAELLMPEAAVIAAYKQNSNLSTIARRFGVSTEAMGYRVSALGLR